MTDQAITSSRAPTRMARYLAAETRLWAGEGLAPHERFVETGRSGRRMRVLEVGAGRPVLFVHGTIGPAAWAPLIRHLGGRRSLVIDRPGWGLSDPVDFPASGMRPFVADLLARALDELDLERVDLVGGSIGDAWVLSLVERHPDRVDSVVLVGGGPLVDAVTVPPMIRVMGSPIGALIVRLPMGRGRLESILRESGHRASVDAGRIPDALIDWRLSAQNDTYAMRHERALVRRVIRGGSWRAGITFDDGALRSIDRPVLLVYGTADPTGDVDTWRRFAATLPNGSLALVDGAGHMPWFDEPVRVASLVERFLAA